ncbi:MAG: formamidopyrimidine-DNA glycosylase [Planctomycetaceae bacterium]|nr:formamidopyrimidine-DNA glycosylase [Planctomycetaceae bacterium]
MPELPDIVVYLDALEERIAGTELESVSIASPFLLRTFDPPLEATFGRSVTELKRLGKRIAIGLDGELWLVLHLMIAGRLNWKPTGAKLSGKVGQALFRFSTGSLILTEAGSKKRASLSVVRSEDLLDHDPGGIDVLVCSVEEFREALTLTNRTLKRQLTNPRLFSGIGNAFSDEILHRARLSPISQTQKLSDDEVHSLFAATRDVLQEWITRLQNQRKANFPGRVTAFRPEMAVHGKYGQPCPVCGKPVQRIVYAENETNYCAQCQTGGRVLADRSLSRLLKQDWPRRIEDWEEAD